MAMNFTWRKIYSTAMWFGTWILATNIFGPLIDNMQDPVMMMILIFMMVFVAPFILALMANIFNGIMVKKTGTNQVLIHQFCRGDFDYMLSEKMIRKNYKAKILKLLSNASATSIKSAIIQVRIRGAVGVIFKVLFIGVVLAERAAEYTTNYIGSGVVESVAGAGGSIFSSPSPAPAGVPDDTWKKKRARDWEKAQKTRAGDAELQFGKNSAAAGKAWRDAQIARNRANRL